MTATTTMPLTSNQIKTFWTHKDDGMKCNASTIPWLVEQGLTEPSDLEDWTAEMLKDLKYRATKPRWVTVAATATNPEHMESRPPPIFSAISMYRISCTMRAVKFYNAVARPLTAHILQWSYIRQAHDELQAFEDKDESEIPKLKKPAMTLPWLEEFKNAVASRKSSRDPKASIAYVIRDESKVPAVTPTLEPTRPYSSEHGSCLDELTARMTHSHHMFAVDNRSLYELLEQALQSTSLEGTISPFKKTHNGRAAFKAVVAQHAGKDKWKAMIKGAQDRLTTPYTGTNPNYSFDKHANNMRLQYANISKAEQHTPHQLANDTSKCNALFETIEPCKDPLFLSGVAECRRDSNKNTDFEEMLAYLNAFCPVATTMKKKGGGSRKRSAGQVSSVSFESGDKVSEGPDTGVEIRYYTTEEYKKLPGDQKQELSRIRDEREKSTGKRHLGPSKKSKKKQKKQTDATKKLIVSEVAKMQKNGEEAAEKAAQESSDMKELVASIAEAMVQRDRQTPATTPSRPSVSALLSRIKRDQGAKKL